MNPLAYAGEVEGTAEAVEEAVDLGERDVMRRQLPIRPVDLRQEEREIFDTHDAVDEAEVDRDELDTDDEAEEDVAVDVDDAVEVTEEEERDDVVLEVELDADEDTVELDAELEIELEVEEAVELAVELAEDVVDADGENGATGAATLDRSYMSLRP